MTPFDLLVDEIVRPRYRVAQQLHTLDRVLVSHLDVVLELMLEVAAHQRRVVFHRCLVGRIRLTKKCVEQVAHV